MNSRYFLFLFFLVALAYSANAAFNLNAYYLNNQTWDFRTKAGNNSVATLTVLNSVQDKTFQDCDLFYCDLKVQLSSKLNVSYNPNTDKFLQLYSKKSNDNFPDLSDVEIFQVVNTTRYENYNIPTYEEYNVTDANGTRTYKRIISWNNGTNTIVEPKLVPFMEVGRLGSGKTDFVLRYTRDQTGGNYDLFFDPLETGNATQLAWWNTSFSSELSFVYFLNSSGETLANFPMMYKINLTSYINAGDLLPTCENMRVVNTSRDVILPYEVEGCNNPNGAIIWFSRPLTPSGNNTFYLYFKNTTKVLDAQNATGLWQGGGYVFVHHGGKSGTTYPDSAYGATGTITGYLSNDTGLMGYETSGQGLIDWGANTRYSNSKSNFSTEAFTANQQSLENAYWSHGQSGSSTTAGEMSMVAATSSGFLTTGSAYVRAANSHVVGTMHWEVIRQNYGNVYVQTALSSASGTTIIPAPGVGERLCTASTQSAGGCNPVLRNVTVSEVRWRNNTATQIESAGWINAIIWAYSYDGTLTTPPTNLVANLTSPDSGATYTTGTNILFIANGTSGGTIANSTLYANFSGSWSANVTQAGSANFSQTINGIGTGYYVWNVLFCDEGGCVFDTSGNHTLIITAIVPPTPPAQTKSLVVTNEAYMLLILVILGFVLTWLGYRYDELIIKIAGASLILITAFTIFTSGYSLFVPYAQTANATTCTTATNTTAYASFNYTIANSTCTYAYADSGVMQTDFNGNNYYAIGLLLILFAIAVYLETALNSLKNVGKGF